ncbi:MAG: guanylate kinase [Cardiobacteriaceae bacterium]|nr:guanylate kinase [Cardiobacteriaceae bacterium]
MKGQLWIVAAPSGGGKTSLIGAAVNALDNVVESISHTTRECRPGEENGVHYHFVSQSEFDALAAQGDFLEWAQVFHHAYGTSGGKVDELLAQGKDVILNIDWQGAQQVRQKRPDTRMVFLLPPSLDALRERLTARGQDSAETVAKRMAQAAEQIGHWREFDYIIVNDDFARAARELQGLILADRLKRERCASDLQALLATLGQ